MILQLKVTLKDTNPPIWRRFTVDEKITFHELHKVIQVVMGWDNSHLYEFRFPPTKIVLTKPEIYLASKGEKVLDTTEAMVEDYLSQGKEVSYTYDFGDNWNHIVQVEEVMTLKKGESAYKCLAGERNCPPEDCGGMVGYAHLQRILADPAGEQLPDHLQLYKNFDPEHFDLNYINDCMQFNFVDIHQPISSKKKLSAAHLRKLLKTYSQTELIELLTEVMKQSTETSLFLSQHLIGEASLDPYVQEFKQQLHRIFFPTDREPNFRLPEVRRMIAQFEKRINSSRHTVDVRLYYVELMIEYLETFRSDSYASYCGSAESMFESVITLLNQEETDQLYHLFKIRFFNILETANNIYDLESNLYKIYNELY